MSETQPEVQRAAADLVKRYRSDIDEPYIIAELGHEVLKNPVAVEMLGGKESVTKTVEAATDFVNRDLAETKAQQDNMNGGLDNPASGMIVVHKSDWVMQDGVYEDRTLVGKAPDGKFYLQNESTHFSGEGPIERSSIDGPFASVSEALGYNIDAELAYYKIDTAARKSSSNTSAENPGDPTVNETREGAVAQIRDVQKIMRRAEQSPQYSGGSGGLNENIGPWDRVSESIAKLEQNPAAKKLLSENGITFENGWLAAKDPSKPRIDRPISISSHQLNPITVPPDLPREVTAQGLFGRPDFKITADVIEAPGMRPESRFIAVVKIDGKVSPEAGNRFHGYPTREEALKMAPVLLRDRIDDNRYKIVPQQKPTTSTTLAQTGKQTVSGTQQHKPFRQSFFSRAAEVVDRTWHKMTTKLSFPPRESREYYFNSETAHKRYKEQEKYAELKAAQQSRSEMGPKGEKITVASSGGWKLGKDGGVDSKMHVGQSKSGFHFRIESTDNRTFTKVGSWSEAYPTRGRAVLVGLREQDRKVAAPHKTATAVPQENKVAKRAAVSNGKPEVSANYWLSLAGGNAASSRREPSASQNQTARLKM